MPTAPVPTIASRHRVASISVSLRRAHDALTAHLQQPAEDARWQELVAARREAAEAIAQLPGAQRTVPAVDATRELLAALIASGANDRTVAEGDLALANGYARQGWTGLFAAMLLTPAWQWPGAPSFEKVPSWLWTDYTQFLFQPTQGFTAVGHAEIFAAHYLRRLGELARLVAANRGSSAVRAAAAAYLKTGNCIPLYFANESLRRHYELRQRILAAAIGVGRQEPIEAQPRTGRRLRVGFVNRHFGPQTETYTTLPMFEQLDPERFEVLLFAHQRTDTAVEGYARRRVAEFHELPADLAAQVEMLRAARLDVVVFGTNVTAVSNQVTLLALHRVAPLQVVNNSSCTTTGQPEIDLYVSGTATESAQAATHFSERLGLVRGPAHAFNYEADRCEPATTFTRASLDLPEDAVVFVTAANYFKIIPEMRRTWARLLAAVPGWRLLWHPFNPNWSSTYPVGRFVAELDQVLTEHGVDSSRLIVSTNRFPSRSDVKTLLAVGDVYLDTFPFGGVNSLVDPLELAMPVVVWEGDTFRSRMGAALLRSIGVTELVATHEADYLAVATRLAGDRAARCALGDRIRLAIETVPDFLDPLAASDGFGALLEAAHDELVDVGRDAFRGNRTPLKALAVDETALLESGRNCLDVGLHDETLEAARSVLGQNPTSVDARVLMGRALSARGRHERAVAYLLGAVQRAGADAMIWYHLARALQKNGQGNETLQAVEGCLRADANCLEGWLMMAELAQAAGNQSLLDETIAMARQVGPNDPRVIGLTNCGLGPAAGCAASR